MTPRIPKAFLPDQCRLRRIHLRTANLRLALGFYSEVLGLTVFRGPAPQAGLSAPGGRRPLVVLTEVPEAPRHPPRSTGLYHVAFRYPTRQDLARAYRWFIQTGCPISGASDHGVSEAIYLTDPDGNGVELYADRPRAQWPREEGQLAMVSRALALNELLALVPDEAANAKPPLPSELGHIHLQVADLAAAERFYSQFLGLAVTQRSSTGTLFFAAGGYHHQVAVNIWASKTAPPANSVGLISYRLEVPLAEILYCLGHRAPLLGYETRTELQEQNLPVLQIRDPDGNWLEVQGPPTAMARRSDSRCLVRSAVARLSERIARRTSGQRSQRERVQSLTLTLSSH